jgi:hypothetical protein
VVSHLRHVFSAAAVNAIPVTIKYADVEGGRIARDVLVASVSIDHVIVRPRLGGRSIPISLDRVRSITRNDGRPFAREAEGREGVKARGEEHRARGGIE